MEKIKQKKVFIVHFQPLELFPPAMNIIDYLSSDSDLKLIIVTNKKSKNNVLLPYDNQSGNVKIYRPSQQKESSIARYLNYYFFYSTAFFLLIKYYPKTVLYFETLSSWPVLMYKKLRGTQTRLMVHYHEYTEPKLYEQGMFLSQWMHRIESKMYKKFSWISHTNPVRLQMFKDDNGLNSIPNSIFHVIPNYPSKSWCTNRKSDQSKNKIIRLVFVGSLGYDNMYLQEVIDWVNNHPGEFSLDVYSYNIDRKAKKVLESGAYKNVSYQGGCNYQELPRLLENYDIGLVIYKPFSQNTIHAVSNKVFEYAACGLDVWFSKDMSCTFEYVRQSVYPKIIPVDFKQMDSFNFEIAISRENLRYEAVNFFYEDIYPEILYHISNTRNHMEP